MAALLIGSTTKTNKDANKYIYIEDILAKKVLITHGGGGNNSFYAFPYFVRSKR
jgi:hypothetical protein